MADPDSSYQEPIRQSVAVVALKVLVLQLVVGLSSVLVNLLLFWLIQHINSDAFLITSLSIANILIQSFDAALLIFIVMQWLDTTYVISHEEIIIRKGIIHPHIERYKTAKIDEVEVEQSFLGRLFNYGTLKFHSQYFERDVRILNIPHPVHYSQIIRQAGEG